LKSKRAKNFLKTPQIRKDQDTIYHDQKIYWSLPSLKFFLKKKSPLLANRPLEKN